MDQHIVYIDDKILDLSRMVKWHPGGSTILKNNKGLDVTDLFHAFHKGISYKNFIVKTRPSMHDTPLYVEDFRKLNYSFEKMGWYHPSYNHFVISILRCLCLWMTSIYFAISKNIVLSGVTMGIFWQQIAGMGHDLGHSSCLSTRKANRLIGSVLSGLTGLSSVWWRNSHFQHHAHTNIQDEDPDIIHVPLFMISDKLLTPFYHNFNHTHVCTDRIAKILIRMQHLTMYPILMFARLNLYSQSIQHIYNKKDMYSRIEKIGILSFLGWHLILFCQMSVIQSLQFVLISHFTSGLLHIQIVISHWACDVTTKTDRADHFLHTLQSTIDVDCMESMDWIHLGLQFQVAHHMFPRLPRYHLRQATYAIREICSKHDLIYNSMTFTDLNIHLWKKMKHVAQTINKA